MRIHIRIAFGKLMSGHKTRNRGHPESRPWLLRANASGVQAVITVAVLRPGRTVLPSFHDVMMLCYPCQTLSLQVLQT